MAAVRDNTNMYHYALLLLAIVQEVACGSVLLNFSRFYTLSVRLLQVAYAVACIAQIHLAIEVSFQQTGILFYCTAGLVAKCILALLVMLEYVFFYHGGKNRNTYLFLREILRGLHGYPDITDRFALEQ